MLKLGDKVRVIVQGKNSEGEIINISECCTCPRKYRVVVYVKAIDDYFNITLSEKEIKEVIK